MRSFYPVCDATGTPQPTLTANRKLLIDPGERYFFMWHQFMVLKSRTADVVRTAMTRMLNNK